MTELGPDHAAVRPQDRAAILFDLGLGGEQADTCARSGDPEAIALLRSACGRPLLESSALLHRLPALSPHRVFCCRIGRVEVYQPIPAPDGRSPEGPHTHVSARLLAHGRLNAATVPVPDGWLAGKQAAFAAHQDPVADNDERRHALGFRIGQRQRRWLENTIAAGSCFNLRARLLLADEPVVSLDPAYALDTMSVLRVEALRPAVIDTAYGVGFRTVTLEGVTQPVAWSRRP